MIALGFKHKSWDETLYEKYKQGDYEAIYSEAENYDSFDDGPWGSYDFYKKLDQRFPGSKFILTTRDWDSWVKSHEKHFSALNLYKKPYLIWKRRYSETEKAKLITGHQERYKGIFEYFSNRPEDLLVINVCNGDGWEKLCPFLDVPIQQGPFPRANMTASHNRTTLDIWKKIIKQTIRELKTYRVMNKEPTTKSKGLSDTGFSL